jgi:hypothetical protein
MLTLLNHQALLPCIVAIRVLTTETAMMYSQAVMRRPGVENDANTVWWRWRQRLSTIDQETT